MRYFFIGIKGSGMSALAIYLKQAGNEVIGSDVSDYFYTEDNLLQENIKIVPYDVTNITSEYIYIIGLSINNEHIEYQKVVKNNYEYYFYNYFIANKIDKLLIAVAGTHGKTTTATYISEMAKNDCSVIIGNGNGKYTANSHYLVVEACEYKKHFLAYYPELLIIQNIDYDHPDYYKTKKSYISSFIDLCQNAKKVLANGDDKNIKKIKNDKIITYGINLHNDYTFTILEENHKGYKIILRGINLTRMIKAKVYGIHNLYNYVAAYIACLLLKINVPLLLSVPQIKRRMEEYFFKNMILIDDYAHHPLEIEMLYKSIRLKYPHYKINCIFQSHTYSRTIKFKKCFKKALKKFDTCYMLDVFSSARENTDNLLQHKIDKYFKCFNKYNDYILKLINGDNYEIWLFLGAGITHDILVKFMLDNKINMQICQNSIENQ